MERGRDTDGPLRVLLADNHVVFRRSLAIALDTHDGIEVVAWVPNNDKPSELARDLLPDVVVMEVRVGLEEAGEALHTIRPPPQVIVLIMIGDAAMMRAFSGLEASGYVTKSSPTVRLVDAIRAAASAPQCGDAGAGGFGGSSWGPLTEDRLTEEDVGGDGADGRA